MIIPRVILIFALISDPVVKLLSEKTGIPPRTISAFIRALKTDHEK